jgi:teichoic acid transport system permease protein
MLSVALLTGEPLRWNWLLLAPILLLQALFNLGGALIAARATDRFRDFENVLPYIFRLLFYMSGVLYSVDRFVEDRLTLYLFNLNPLYAIISLARNPILGTPTSSLMWASASAWALAALVGGFFFFRAAEQSYGRA